MESMKLRTALLVEDSPSARRVFQSLLEQCGLEVAVAGSGEEALGYLEALLPDIVFLDNLMRGMSGLETAREIAARPACAGIPVILLTSDLTAAFLAEARRHGAYTALPKRADLALFQDLLTELRTRGPEAVRLSPAPLEDVALVPGEAERLARDLGNLLGQAFAPVADLVFERLRSELLFRGLNALEAARPQLTEAVRGMVEEIVREALAEQAGAPPVPRLHRDGEAVPGRQDTAPVPRPVLGTG